MNILCISTFSMLSLFNIEYLNENYVRPLLISYFVIDSYKNKPDIIIHHTICSILTIICQFEYIHKTLLLEWSTLFLLLYKKGYRTKELFLIAWIGTRLIYTPYLFYTFEPERYIINFSIAVYSLHFHWTCKIINPRIDTTNGWSSMLLMIIPLNILYNVSLYTYMVIYIQSQISFYYRVFNTRLMHNLDVSMIMYISLNYLKLNYWMSLLYFIYRQKYNSALHRYIFILSLAKLTYLNYEIIPYIMPGLYSENKSHVLHKYIWHISAGIILGYCLM